MPAREQPADALGPRDPSAQFLDQLGDHPAYDDSWRYRSWRPRWDPAMVRIWFKIIGGLVAIGVVGLSLDPWVPHEWSGPVLIGGAMLYLLAREMADECQWGWRTAVAWAAAFAALCGGLGLVMWLSEVWIGHPLAIFLLGLFAACLLLLLSVGLRAFGRWLLNLVRSF